MLILPPVFSLTAWRYLSTLICLLKISMHPHYNFGFGHGAHKGVFQPAIVKKQQRWNASRVKPGVCLWVGVYIQFADPEPSLELNRQSRDDRSDHCAGAAPRGPAIHEHRDRRSKDFFLEIGIRDQDVLLKEKIAGFQRSAAFSAFSRLACMICRNAVPGSA